MHNFSSLLGMEVSAMNCMFNVKVSLCNTLD